MATNAVQFFAMRAGDAIPIGNEDRQDMVRIWRPSLREIVPPGLPRFPYAVWWIMHSLRIFRNSGYCVLVAYDRGEAVHRCVVTPGWFRFPFMASDDLQIGDVWTREDHRRLGWAACGISEVLRREPCKERKYWYLTTTENLASVRAAERSGFRLAGSGRRISIWGIPLIGRYILEKKQDSAPIPAVQR